MDNFASNAEARPGDDGLPSPIALLRSAILSHRELRALQTRLGTPLERRDDLRRAGDLAHHLNNLHMAIIMRERLVASVSAPSAAAAEARATRRFAVPPGPG